MLAEKTHWCPRKTHWRPLLSCLKCPRYPCSGVSREDERILHDSLFTEISATSRLLQRKTSMYLFRHSNGKIEEAYSGFNPDTPQFDQLSDVEEVLFVGKVFIKQLKLVVKPFEERQQIRSRTVAQQKENLTQKKEKKGFD